MRKFKQILVVLIAGTFLSLTSCDKERILPETSIPKDIKSYVSTYFPTSNILQVVKDMDGFTISYDVLLSENISLEFNRKKEIISIDGNSALPSTVIPEKIRNYVSTNFPTNFITDWEIEGRNQQVGLDNDIDLEFTMSGDFIKIDN